MKKPFTRIVSATIAVLMILSATMLLASCKAVTEIGNATDAKAITITLTSIRGENTTDEAIALVQNAINAITEVDYNVHVVLQMISADEYQQKIYDMSANLEKKFNEVAEEFPKYDDEEVIRTMYERTREEVTVDENATWNKKSNGDLVVYDEYGIMSTVFPNKAEEQLDILLINGLDMFTYMLSYSDTKKVYLNQLDSLINTNAPVINKYVNSAARSRLSTANVGTYALPNNRVYGSYEYMLINRELFDKYGYNIDSITKASDVEQFLYDVAENEEDVSPMYNYKGLKWLTFYENDNPLLVKPAETEVDTQVSQYPTNILGYALFKNTTTMIYNLKKNYNKTYIDTDVVDFDAKWGVAFMSGDTTVSEKYGDDYYVVTLQTPFIENEMYDAMYAISSFCQYPDRCTEILSLLETNEKLVNILAYGIEGTNYDIDKNGVIINRRGGWDMDVIYSGNNFLLKQNEDMTEQELAYSANNWELGKKQNTRASVGLYTGFTLNYDTNQDHIDPLTKEYYADDETGEKIQYILVSEIIDGVYALADDIYAKIDAFDGSYVDSTGKTVECGMDEYLKVLATEVSSNKYFQAATLSGSYKRNTTWSPQGQYTNFFLNVYK